MAVTKPYPVGFGGGRTATAGRGEYAPKFLRTITFIPRVRCGIDAAENLVRADRRCNNDERDLLPGPRT